MKIDFPDKELNMFWKRFKGKIVIQVHEHYLLKLELNGFIRIITIGI